MNMESDSQTPKRSGVGSSDLLGILGICLGSWFAAGCIYIIGRSLWFVVSGGPPKEPPDCDVVAMGAWIHGTIFLALAKGIVWAWKR